MRSSCLRFDAAAKARVTRRKLHGPLAARTRIPSLTSPLGFTMTCWPTKRSNLLNARKRQSLRRGGHGRPLQLSTEVTRAWHSTSNRSKKGGVNTGHGEFPLLKTLCGCLARAEDEGMGDDDFSALIRLLAAR